jgi:Holliday junction resolvase RusA-like endonuclease
MTSITIIIPLPPHAVKPNARCHWRAKATAVKRYRKAAWAAAMGALQGAKPPMWVKAKAHICAFYPTLQRPDPDNLVSSCKSVFDGFADAGIIANDRDLWPERPTISKDKENPRIEITITQEN